jgi:hypothetical protein
MNRGAHLQTDLLSHTFHCFVKDQLNRNLSGSANLVLKMDKINHFVQLLHIRQVQNFELDAVTDLEKVKQVTDVFWGFLKSDGFGWKRRPPLVVSRVRI